MWVDLWVSSLESVGSKSISGQGLGAKYGRICLHLRIHSSGLIELLAKHSAQVRQLISCHGEHAVYSCTYIYIYVCMYDIYCMIIEPFAAF